MLIIINNSLDLTFYLVYKMLEKGLSVVHKGQATHKIFSLALIRLHVGLEKVENIHISSIS